MREQVFDIPLTNFSAANVPEGRESPHGHNLMASES